MIRVETTSGKQYNIKGAITDAVKQIIQQDGIDMVLIKGGLEDGAESIAVPKGTLSAVITVADANADI